jgi:hypothetical protein
MTIPAICTEGLTRKFRSTAAVNYLDLRVASFIKTIRHLPRFC